jgi:phosphate:Na+ symporter
MVVACARMFHEHYALEVHMDTKDLLEIIPSLLGGLAIFVFGMNMLAEGLQKVAGEKLRKIISLLTSNPIIGILVGILVTALVQSSSATTVMVIGFVSAGLMTLKQAIGVILGANIGTTITAWLVSIKIGDYALLLVAVGFILFFFIKAKKVRYIGQIIFSLGLLFVGLNIMSDMMAPLAKAQAMENLILQVTKNKWIGMMVGAIFTAIVQSSSAAIAILQKLSNQTTASGEALMSLSAALPILFGSNIGTTITAVLASIGASISAKRTALTHTIFNLVGSLIFVFFLGPFEKLVNLVMGGPAIAGRMDTAIAYSHSMFNVVNTVLFIPFIGLLAKLVTAIIKGKEPISEKTLVYIGSKVSSPTIALDMAMKEMLRMGRIVQKMVESTKEIILEQNAAVIPEVEKMEDTVDMLQHEILNYLSNIISDRSLTQIQSVRLTGYMRMVHDLERIGDHCDSSTKLGSTNIENKIQYSETALNELKDVFEKIELVMDNTLMALEKNDRNLVMRVFSEENNMDDIEKVLRARHLDRLNKGECNPHTAITYVELIHTMERMTDNCKNIAESVMDDINHRLMGHYDTDRKGVIVSTSQS